MRAGGRPWPTIGLLTLFLLGYVALFWWLFERFGKG